MNFWKVYFLNWNISRIRGLCLIKNSNETNQNWVYIVGIRKLKQSVLLEHFAKHKPPISEEFSTVLIYQGVERKNRAPEAAFLLKKPHRWGLRNKRNCFLNYYYHILLFHFQVFHDMASFVRSESIVSLNCPKDCEVIDIPRCYYTRWAGENNMKEDLIILENLYPQVIQYIINSYWFNKSTRSPQIVQIQKVRFHYNNAALYFWHKNILHYSENAYEWRICIPRNKYINPLVLLTK